MDNNNMDNNNMNNIESFNQSLEKDYFKPIIKSILLVVFGIIIGTGIFFVSDFFFSEDVDGISKKTQIEIEENFKNDIVSNYPVLFEGDLGINIYTTEEGKDIIGVSARIDLSNKQFEKVFGIGREELESKELKGMIIIAQGQYKKGKEEWMLKEKIKIYQGIDFDLLQESLGSAKDKARDSAIKAELLSMRATAEMWAMDNEDSYNGFCTSADAQEAMAFIKENRSNATCDDAVNKWAIFAPLHDTTAQCYCVDYQGISTSSALNSPCPGMAVTACP